MPGLMKPVEYNNRVLIDGDIQKSAPMWKLSKTLQPEDSRILEFRLEGNFEGKDKNAIDYLNSVYSYATCTATDFITDLYGCCDRYDYIIINTGDLNIVDFNLSEEKREQLFSTGYEQTKNYFENVLVQKKINLANIYAQIKTHLEKISSNLRANKIMQAKQHLGELYIYLADYLNLINELDYKQIKNFKDIFLENIKYPALFGKTTLKNEVLVNTTLKQCIQTISEKLIDLNNYIEND